MRFERLTISGLYVAGFAILAGCAGVQGTYTQKAGGSLVGVSRKLVLGCDFGATGSYYASQVEVPEASITGRWRMAGDTLVILWQEKSASNTDERYKMWDQTMQFLVKGRKLKRVRAKTQGQRITDMVMSVGLREIDRRYPFKQTERERCK
jgi:hypothetical protein